MYNKGYMQNYKCLKKMNFINKFYVMGFFATDAKIDTTERPFLCKWKKHCVCNCHIYVHPKQTYFINGRRILIGHAYNPFTMEADENRILESLTEESLNQLTGIFTILEITDKGIKIVGDATCMQCTFYGVINGHFYVSTHANLIGDLLGLEWDPYIKQLTEYKFFKLFGTQLPGNLSEYKEIKRLVPNHIVTIENGEIKEKRFYWPHTCNLSKDEIVNKASNLLHNNLQLIAKKWTKPAISLTGGCDSKTTLACANGLYDKFSYFSYISSDEEKVDAEAAHSICKKLGLKHEIYDIPRDDSCFENIEDVRKVINYNCGNMRPSNANDVRKRAWFADKDLFDIEVKSWVSEIGRAYYSKRFNGRTDFGDKPTPRKCSTLYKVFAHNRSLLRRTDKAFAEYLDIYFESADENALPWQEQFFWEFRVAAWNALVITHEHRYSFDITIPYNNRILLEYLLSAPLEDRINDTIYKDIRSKMNPEIDNTNISVQNVKHTSTRAEFENAYYVLNRIIP